jgi:hypothetical protein
MNGKSLIAILLFVALSGVTQGVDESVAPCTTDVYERLWSSDVDYADSADLEHLKSMAVPFSFLTCKNGGQGSTTCEIRCNRIFGFYYSRCSIECDEGYYACCNCSDGAVCSCYLDHEELWPVFSGQ